MATAAGDNAVDGSLLGSARSGDLKDVVHRVSRGEDLNNPGAHGITPLHLASLHGRLEVVQFLLDNGAEIEAADEWGCTPLHNAAGGGQTDIIKELMDKGANANARTSKDKTPLEVARDKGKYEAIQLLQAYNTGKVASARPPNNSGQQPAAAADMYEYSGPRGAVRSVMLRRKKKTKKTKKRGSKSKNVRLPGQISSSSSDSSSSDDDDVDRDMWELKRAVDDMQFNVDELSGQIYGELGAMRRKLRHLQGSMQNLRGVDDDDDYDDRHHHHRQNHHHQQQHHHQPQHQHQHQHQQQHHYQQQPQKPHHRRTRRIN